MKQYKRTLIITSIITILPILIGLLLWPKLPEVMATHFASDNTPNGWSSKPFTVFGLPLFMLVLQFIVMFFTLNDPRKSHYDSKIIRLIMWIIPIVSLFACVTTYTFSLGIPLDINFIGSLFCGALFIAIGNYLPKCRRNYTIGIKIAWTLSSDENWDRTHRLGSWVWTLGGLVIFINTFIGLPYVIPIVLAMMMLIPFGYSFWLFKQGI